MKIWCLFVIYNRHDQPDFNLVAWWQTKPHWDKVAFALNLPSFSPVSQRQCEYLLDGEHIRISNDEYRLEQVEEAKPLMTKLY